MKKMTLKALSLLLVSFSLFACGDSKNTPTPPPTVEGQYFQVWSPVDAIIGMGSVNMLVQRTNTLESGEISFVGKGADLSEKIPPSIMQKGKYAYAVTKNARFGKYIIGEANLEVVKEVPFTQLKDRRHTHVWLDDKTLLLIGSNGKADKILWIKVNTDDLSVIAEGELALPEPDVDKGEKFNTSGVAAYRKADNKVMYSFCYKGKTERNKFYLAFINPTDMSVLKVVEEDRAQEMTTTAFGELFQSKTFFDEKGDYYLSAMTVLEGEGSTTAQRGHIFRVKAGAMEFDKSYDGYTKERGKIVTMNYIGNGKAILYMQDPMHTAGTKVWDANVNPYMFYFILLDLNSGAVTNLDIPFGVGNFPQLVLVDGGKAYIGANKKDGNATVYVYDIKSGSLKPGLTLADGKPIYRLSRVTE